LDGDRDVLYYLTHAVKNNGGAFGVQVRFNSDSGTNYGYQSLDATNTTVSALRDTAETRFIVGYNSTSGYYCQGNMLMFVKKGFIRPALVSRVDSVSGTTVTAMKVYGKSWNNTADNITSLVVSASANNFDTGSQFDLYALRPNG
jgi:hypothetical protein